MPNDNVLTYANQPDNVGAWRLGEACRAAKAGGDPIDHGLSLLKELQARGYGVVALAVHPGQPEPRDAIARSKRILGLVDEYHDNPTRDTRTALRVALMDEFQPEPRAEVTGERRHWNPVYNTNPVQRACAELPEGWEIQACMENGAGWVDVYDPTGEKLDFDSDADHFDWRIHEAIDFAIDAARAGASS